MRPISAWPAIEPPLEKDSRHRPTRILGPRMGETERLSQTPVPSLQRSEAVELKWAGLPSPPSVKAPEMHLSDSQPISNEATVARVPFPWPSPCRLRGRRAVRSRPPPPSMPAAGPRPYSMSGRQNRIGAIPGDPGRGRESTTPWRRPKGDPNCV